MSVVLVGFFRLVLTQRIESYSSYLSKITVACDILTLSFNFPRIYALHRAALYHEISSLQHEFCVIMELTRPVEKIVFQAEKYVFLLAAEECLR